MWVSGFRRQDAVRASFNSPFRPFVLASTSVGQEGLDFHPWCHRLIHWNLPGNPVDMEQREGRVHRYKGHAVRRNLAHSFSSDALGAWQPGNNLWDVLFDLANGAARNQGLSDLIPFWIAPGPCRVERRVPLFPFTSEVAAFSRLKRQLAAYRVVFGQPRQEELLSLLNRADIEPADRVYCEIESVAICRLTESMIKLSSGGRVLRGLKWHVEGGMLSRIF